MALTVPKSLVVAPGRNGLFATAAVALSLFVFAYSVRFGQLSILALYAVWALPVAVEPRLLLARLPVSVLVLSLGGLAAASTLWSAAPDATLRAAIQYLTTLGVGIVAARVVSPRDLARGGIVGVAMILAYSLSVGAYSYDFLDATYAFVGAFRSKNQLGWFASLGVLFAAMLILDRRTPALWRLAAPPVAVAGAAALLASQSATSIITLAVALALAGALAVLARVPATERLVVILLGAVAVALLLAVAVQAGAFGELLAAFGKDATLTGRTYLWNQGIEAAQENPIFGLGYSAFWVIGNPAAERLWEAFYITARTGFHFHNTYIEAAVELGLVGLAAVVMLVLVYIGATVRVLFLGRPGFGAVLLAAIGALLVMRSFVEIDFLQPYTVGSFLLAWGLTRLLSERPARRPYPAGPAPRSAPQSAGTAR